MSESPSNLPPPPDERESNTPTKRLAGELTIRELELRDQELRLQAEQAERRARYLFTASGVVSLLVLAYLGMTWQRLDAQFQQARDHLEIIQGELDTQLTETLRYAPLPDRGQEATRQKLDEARADLVSRDVADQLQGIHDLQEFLRPRIPVAKARVRTNLAPLFPDFQDRLDHSQAVVREQTRQYVEAAQDYNHRAREFPTSLVRLVLRYPERLPRPI